MFNFIFEALVYFAVEVLFGKVLKSFFLFVQDVGLRTYSVFTGEPRVPIKVLRKKYDDSSWPWWFGFLAVGLMIYGMVLVW